MFAGGAPGDGQQWFSWIHMDDCVSALVRAMADPAIEGPVNITAPRPVRMQARLEMLHVALRPTAVVVSRL